MMSDFPHKIRIRLAQSYSSTIRKVWYHPLRIQNYLGFIVSDLMYMVNEYWLSYLEKSLDIWKLDLLPVLSLTSNESSFSDSFLLEWLKAYKIYARLLSKAYIYYNTPALVVQWPHCGQNFQILSKYYEGLFLLKFVR